MEKIGYTKDGKVWMTLSVNINGQAGEATFEMEVQNALKISEGLKGAAGEALKIVGTS